MMELSELLRMATAFVIARQHGKGQLEPFLARWSNAGPAERDYLVGVANILNDAEVAGDNMGEVYRQAAITLGLIGVVTAADKIAAMSALPPDAPAEVRWLWSVLHDPSTT